MTFTRKLYESTEDQKRVHDDLYRHLRSNYSKSIRTAENILEYVVGFVESSEIASTVNGIVAAGGFIWPCASTFLTSTYGYRIHPIFKTRKLHAGIDIGCNTGTDVYAANTGVVELAGDLGGYGIAIIINHGRKVTTFYAHLSRLLVEVGETVQRGAVIAKSGSTGFSTGPHLHFEVRVNDVSTDPLKGYVKVPRSR